MMREATLTAVRFPDQLRVEAGRGPARVVHLVDDPIVDRLRDGDPVFGWDGDNRLALYLDVPAGMWELWRYEATGVLEVVTRFPTDRYSATAIIPAAILWLREHDTRRSFDPFVAVTARNDRARAQRAAESAAMVDEAAARVKHALVKDGA